MTRPTTARRASLVVAAMTLLSIPLAAQNPAPPPAPMPRAGMPCDSACRANQGGMMGQMDHQMPMGQGQMQHSMMGNQGNQGNQGGMGGMMMACPMMASMHGRMGGNQGGMSGMQGGMGGMQGMQGHDMAGTQGRQGMARGAMPADSAAVRNSADQHATFIRAYYQALVSKGFTAEQALRIITSQAMPGGR